MGIRERRVRERLEVRQGILDAAREIALSEGWNAVTIRKVADRIEYSPPTIYEYFASKEDILAELAREGLRLLREMQNAARESSQDPETQLRTVLHAYWDFATAYPELYQVIHGLDGVTMIEKDVLHREAHETFDITLSVIEDLANASHLRLPEPMQLVTLLWATMHGLVSLNMAHHIKCSPEEKSVLVDTVAQHFIVAVRTLYQS